MLFRPKFCANCGEKIARTDWGIFTSRRFCEVCESVYKGQELLPRIVVGLGLIIGLFGIGGYLKSGGSVSETQLAKQPRRLADQALPVAQAATKDVPVAEVNAVNQAFSATRTPAVVNRTEARIQEPPKLTMPQIETAVEVYFCGAETKKGAPCRRRVKGPIRCFQHLGMPAMLQPEKLRIN